ncbi:MAG: carboxylating nicotinate-nucleotide diphosphorylase [Acidimicrobiales bacterium]
MIAPPAPAVRAAVALALAEDLGALGDLTAALLPTGAWFTGALVARQAGVLAGRMAAAETFAQVSSAIAVTWRTDDGDRFALGQVLAEVSGPAAEVLTAERTALNFLSHLSGVATLTRRYVDLVEGVPGTRAIIRDTRKTTPGLRALEKAAVRAGGGANHRASLSEAVLVKDNHLAGVAISAVVGQARRMWPGRTVQVECDRLDQVVEAKEAGADLVLLDNMSPAQVQDCVAAVAGGCLIEVSGGVSLQTVAAYAIAGADFISVGAITHSAPIVDIALDATAPDAGGSSSF